MNDSRMASRFDAMHGGSLSFPGFLTELVGLGLEGWQ